MKEIKQVKVSIITPSYNQGEFIEETILSVLSQDYPNIEYIVMDGGSNDNTLDILRKYQNRITWFSEPDKGQSDAINKGWRIATGEILAWLNSDDTYLPGTINKIVEYFRNNPQIKMVHGAAYYTDKNNKLLRPYISIPNAQDYLSEACYICQPATFIKREIINTTGFVDEALHYCMDYDFAIRISKKYDMGYIDEYLATSRLYNGNKSSDLKMQVEAELLQKKYFGKISFDCFYMASRSMLRVKLSGATRVASKENIILKLLAITIAFYQFTKFNKRIPFIQFIKWVNINMRFRNKKAYLNCAPLKF